MGSRAKYLTYIIICAAVLIVSIKIFGGSFSPNSASAFEWEKPVNIYFSNKGMGSDEDCSKTFPVPRTISNAETLGPGALEALLAGVSDSEKTAGYYTLINNGVLIQKFEIKNKTAYVDFNSIFSEEVAGSCKVTAIKSQIENTLDSLPDIDSVVISINGQTKGILEP